MSNRNAEKGKAFEREVAKAFSAAFDEVFTRSAQSGAWMGGKNATRAASEAVRRDRTGDITPPDGWGMVIECKHVKAVPNLLHGPSAQIDEWLEQLCADCESIGGALGILVFKANRAPAILMSRIDLESAIGENTLTYLCGDPEKDVFRWHACKLESVLSDSYGRQLIREEATCRQ